MPSACGILLKNSIIVVLLDYAANLEEQTGAGYVRPCGLIVQLKEA